MKIGQAWAVTPPVDCDICNRPLMRTFVDGWTRDGRWAIMCPLCRLMEGREQLGTGLGQKFERAASGGPWLKTAG